MPRRAAWNTIRIKQKEAVGFNLSVTGGFEMLRTLPQPVLPVLREEAVPARAASDIAFMKSFF